MEQDAKSVILSCINLINTVVPVEWDRYVFDEVTYYMYGWIARSDGQRDFLVLLFQRSKDVAAHFNIDYITSSAKYSKPIMKVLTGSDEGHVDCIKTDEIFA